MAKVWLDDKTLKVIAYELLTKDYSSRVPERLEYLYSKYARANGLKMFDVMADALLPLQERLESWFEYIVMEDKRPLTYEETIEDFKSNRGFPSFTLFGSEIAKHRGKTIGMKEGDLTTWVQVDQLRNQILSFKLQKGAQQNLKVQGTKSEDTSDTNREKNSHIEIAERLLKPFAGKNLSSLQIMSNDDYKIMMSYVEYMIKNNAIPDKIEPISTIKLSNQFIRYTFYLLHKELYGNNMIHDYFIDFIQKFFSQFKNQDPKTTKTKFSTAPSSYEADVAKMLNQG